MQLLDARTLLFLIGVSIAFGGFAYWTYVTPSVVDRIRWASFFLASFSVSGAWVCWHGADTSTRVGSSFLASGLLALGVLQGFRGFLSHELFEADSFTGVALCGAMLSFYGIILGVFMVVGERHLKASGGFDGW